MVVQTEATETAENRKSDVIVWPEETSLHRGGILVILSKAIPQAANIYFLFGSMNNCHFLLSSPQEGTLPCRTPPCHSPGGSAAGRVSKAPRPRPLLLRPFLNATTRIKGEILSSASQLHFLLLLSWTNDESAYFANI